MKILAIRGENIASLEAFDENRVLATIKLDLAASVFGPMQPIVANDHSRTNI